MKRGWVLLLLMTLLVWSGSVDHALAANRAGAFTLSPMIGGYQFDSEQNLDDGFSFGLGAGYNLTRHLGLEAALHYFESSPEDDGRNDIDTWVAHLDALVHLRPDKAFVPYLALGAGGIFFQPDRGGSDDDALVNYGAGFKFFFDDDIATRFDVRHVYAFDGPDNNYHFTLGMVWQFGGEKKAAPAPFVAPVMIVVAEPAPEPVAVPVPAPAPPPKDSDGDGVPDDRDRCPDTPAGVMVDEHGCEVKLTLYINFDHDKAEIKPEFSGELRKAADFIHRYPGIKILVAGHTDSTGTEAYNQKLSERRAAAAREALIGEHGIEADRLAVRGYGESRPIADNGSAEGRYQNRRVEIICCTVLPE